MTETMTKIWKLSDILRPAQTGGFAVGSFSPRYTKLIRPIVQAGMALRSPLIVQISEKEIYRCIWTIPKILKLSARRWHAALPR